MSLSPGTRLGVYEILSRLGAGGMGEVYKARDTRLDRDVAIKILPADVAQDPEHLGRFEREAKILASLNHPHIAQIYGDIETEGVEGEGVESVGLHGLVMELVPGETLASMIDAGRIPLETTLEFAKQIAEALEAAHEKGVIHRDLKPANVMVTPDSPQGRSVKVLDFGLAAAQVPEPVIPQDRSQLPTLTLSPTRTGMLLGTTAYMSPEQTAGQPLDKRSDIWSFGVLLWEMLTGKRLFSGNTVAHVVAEVLRKPIDYSALPVETPASVRNLLRRCLDRDPRTRLRDIGEARVAIHDWELHPEPQAAGTLQSRMNRAAWTAAGLALTAALLLAYVHFREASPELGPVRFQISPPYKSSFLNTAVFSPDGTRVVFAAPGPDGQNILWVRPLDSEEARPLPGTEGAAVGIFWSPDSQFVAFGVNGTPGRLKKIRPSDGSIQILCEFSGGFRDGSWNRDGVILFGVDPSGIWRVPDSGGTPTQVTAIDTTRAELQHSGPRFLPDGKRFLYHRVSRQPENQGVYIGTTSSGPGRQNLKPLFDVDSDVVYAGGADGEYLLYVTGGALFARPFDSGRGEFTGEAVMLADDCGVTGTYGWFSVSSTGALAFRRGRNAVAPNQLFWFDRSGKEVGRVGVVGEPSSNEVQLSPDGQTVAVTRGDRLARNGTRVWVADLARGIFSRLDANEGAETSMAFAPDGHVIFSSSAKGALGDLYWIAPGGTGTPELLFKSPDQKHPNSVSPNGNYLIYDDHNPTQQDLWILPLKISSGAERKPVPLVATPADESFGQFSPDGKWIAYTSDESGRREVYVRPFAPERSPAVGAGKWQISSAGGDKPRWRRDGKELYYLAPDKQLMAVPVRTGNTFTPGLAVPLFTTRAAGFFPYDVGADGRFLINTLPEPDETISTPVTVVLNWKAELKK